MAQPAARLDHSSDSQTHHGILRALRHRNYRLFFGGQLISLVGTFMTNTATSWLAYSLTKSPDRKAQVLGIVGFASQIPLFFLAPVAGVWVDRVNRQKLLVITQTLAMLQSFVLAFLALSHRITIPQVIFLAVCQGLINAFDMPGRQSFLVEMVDDREDLSNAIALNSTMVHGGRILGPALAGFIIYYLSTGWCFLLDGISYLAVIAALIAMVIKPRPSRPSRSILVELKEGVIYVFGFPPMRVLLLTMMAFSLTGIPSMIALTPIFAGHFGGDKHGAQVLGFLGAASALGALSGAIYLASRKTVLGLGSLIAFSSIIYSVAIAGFALSNSLALTLAIAPIAGWGMLTNFASANTILQTLADDDKRGRVMSFFSMCFVGMTPFGVLAAGEMATYLGKGRTPFYGASHTILIAAGICFIASLLYARALPSVRKAARPVYIKRGVIKEIAEGIAAATKAAEPMEE